VDKESKAKILEAMEESISKLPKRYRKRLLISIENKALKKRKEKSPA